METRGGGSIGYRNDTTTQPALSSPIPSTYDDDASRVAYGAHVADRLARAMPINRADNAEGGFSLVEVLVATSVLIMALTGLAQLFALSTRANGSARATTYTSILAQHKMEQLRGLAFGFDSLNQPVTDTTSDTTVVPEASAGGTGLQLSPIGSLGANTVGFVDYLDAHGMSLGGASPMPPAGTVYIRRWSIKALPANPNNAIVLQVLVTRARNRGNADTPNGSAMRLPDEARVVGLKCRKTL